jgi:predicted butyrate kinase (DUF1464 family)
VTRVAGCDPGTSSLDVVVLEGEVRGQKRFSPDELRADATAPVRWLEAQGPLDLVAAPSGYGLPLIRRSDCTERDLALMSLVRPDDPCSQGVGGFSAVVRAFRAADLPVVFLPGVIHLPTVPAHRKLNKIDLGTADKLSVAALALALSAERLQGGACVVELGSAFTACVVIDRGSIVDGLGGTSGPVGWLAAGALDGEFAYLLSPLNKRDLFAGGVQAFAGEWGRDALVEGVLKMVAGLRAATPCAEVVLAGRLLEQEADVGRWLEAGLTRSGGGLPRRLGSLPGAWVKQAAQGAAVLADGLAGGPWAWVVDSLQLRGASGSVLDWLRHPRAEEVRGMFE